MKPKDGWRHRQAQGMKRFAGLSSFQPRSWLRGCLCFSLSHRRRLVAITTKHCTVHMSVTWRRAGVVAWTRATYQYHVNGTDTVGQSRISLCTDIAHEKKIAGLPQIWILTLSLRNLTPRISEFLHANLHQRVCSRSREKRTSKHGISMIISSQY